MEAGLEQGGRQRDICADSTCSTASEADEVNGRAESSTASYNGTAGVHGGMLSAVSTPVSGRRNARGGSKRRLAGSRSCFSTGLLLLLFGSVATCTLAQAASSLPGSDSVLAPAAPPDYQVPLQHP